MTYYEDLKPYQYWTNVEIPEILNIGWLGKEQQYVKGNVSKNIIKKLEQVLLTDNQSQSQPIVNKMRGFFDCEICNVRSDRLKITNDKHSLLLGNAELLIPYDGKQGYYFSCPTLIHHYITAHDYLPPKEFLDSLIQLDLNNQFQGSTIFRNYVEKYGGFYIH